MKVSCTSAWVEGVTAADRRRRRGGAAAGRSRWFGHDGGSAEIIYDETAPELESKVAIINRGGQGGYGEGGTGRSGRPGALPRVSRAPADVIFHDEIAHGFNIRRSARPVDLGPRDLMA